MITYTPVKVRYGETDKMGIVYHANYLLYFEDGRTDFLEQAGFPYASIEERGYLCPAYSAELSWRAPLRYGDDAVVETRVIANGGTKTIYQQRVFRAGDDPAVDKPVAEGRITACTVDRDTFKPVSIKRELPDLYERYNALIEPEA